MRLIPVLVPVGEDYYALVNVWHELADYQAATTDKNDACFIAYNLTDENDKPLSIFPCIGSVNLVKGNIDAGLVAHEFLHAAFHLAVLQDNHDEEYVCESVQEMNRNFWEAVQNSPVLYDWIYEGEYGEED